jgi:HEAT repeats
MPPPRLRRDWILPGFILPVALSALALLLVPEAPPRPLAETVAFACPIAARPPAPPPIESRPIASAPAPVPSMAPATFQGPPGSLEARISAEPDLALRIQILDSYGHGTEQDADSLIDLLAGPPPSPGDPVGLVFRARVIAKLGKMADDRSLSFLVGFAADRARLPAERTAAIQALTRKGLKPDTYATNVLRHVADQDPDASVRAAAETAVGAPVATSR